MSLPPCCAHVCSHFPAGSGCGCCPAPMSSTGTVWIPGSCCSRPALSASATSWVRTGLAPGPAPADPGARAGENLGPARLPVPRLSVLPCRELLHGQLAGPRTHCRDRPTAAPGTGRGAGGARQAALAAGAGLVWLCPHSAQTSEREGLGALLPGLSRGVAGPDGQYWGGRIWGTHGCNRVGAGAGRALVLLCSCPAHSNFSKSWVFCLFTGGRDRVGRAWLQCQPLWEVGGQG